MKVEFYGHVRQYHNIKSEIDQNIQTVLESSQYVMGPMLKRFEAELAAYHGTKHAIGVGTLGIEKADVRFAYHKRHADEEHARYD